MGCLCEGQSQINFKIGPTCSTFRHDVFRNIVSIATVIIVCVRKRKELIWLQTTKQSA